MYVKGLDNGYLYTKDNDHHIFKSAFSPVSDLLQENNKIIVNGCPYYFGVGTTCTDIDKIDSDVNKICTLANIAISGSNDYFLAVNLPMIQYKTNKDKFRETIMRYNNYELIYKNKLVKFNIHNVLVLPQCFVSALLLPNQNEEKIIIDIGSNTIQFALFTFDSLTGKVSITKSQTLFKGLLHLYHAIMDEINSNNNLNEDDIKAQYFLMGNPLIVDGVKKDLSYIPKIIKNYLLDILKDFKLEFPYRTTPIYVTGGGCELLYPIFQKNFPNCFPMKNSQFTNSDGLCLYAKNYLNRRIL